MLNLDDSHQHPLTLPDEAMQSRTPRPKPPSPNWTPQPPLAVFVRNLQLLQLDRHDDWPQISPRSLTDTSQNQRQRVKAIEWALYHLITLWDPSTARDVWPPSPQCLDARLTAAETPSLLPSARAATISQSARRLVPRTLRFKETG